MQAWIDANENRNFYCENGGDTEDMHNLFIDSDLVDYFDFLKWVEEEFD